MTILIKNWSNRCSRISWSTLTALEIKLGNYMYRYNFPWQVSQCIIFHFLQWWGLISSHNHNFKYNCRQYEFSLTPFYWGGTCPPISGSWERRRIKEGGWGLMIVVWPCFIEEELILTYLGHGVGWGLTPTWYLSSSFWVMRGVWVLTNSEASWSCRR